MSSSSSRFAIGIHVLSALGYLQKHGVDRVSSREIAKSVNTNPVVIRELIRSLKKAGLVKSVEGKGGGISLAKSPADISLDQIYLALKDSSLLKANRNTEIKHCPVSCGMTRILPTLFNEVDLAVDQILSKKTLAGIISQI